MSNDSLVDLAGCTEFAQAVQARPPRFLNGVMALFLVLLGAAVGWAALTEADVVVSAPGLVRPVTPAVEVKARAGGPVGKVNFCQGQWVEKDQVLLELDSEEIDHEIEQAEQRVRAGEQELEHMGLLKQAMADRLEAAKGRAQARLDLAKAEALRAKNAIPGLEAAWKDAKDNYGRMEALSGKRAVAPREVVQAKTQMLVSQAKLAEAKVLVEEAKALALKAELPLLDADHGESLAELELKVCAKRSEVADARLKLGGLRIEEKKRAIRAPLSGVVMSREPHVGELVRAGGVAAVIAEQAPPTGRKRYHFEAKVHSVDVGLLKAGMQARVKLDPFNYQDYGTLPGTVVTVSPESQGREGQQSGQFLVTVELEADELWDGGRQGQAGFEMAGQAEIVAERASLLRLLVRRVRQAIRLG